MTKCQIIFESIKVAVSIAIPVTTALLAYRHFLSKRKQEQLFKRYVEEGIDDLVENIECVLSVFQHNWIYALSVLKQYRDADTVDSFDKFIGVDIAKMKVVPAFRVQSLLGTQSVWKLYQSACAFSLNNSLVFETELASPIKGILDGSRGLAVSKEDIVARCEQVVLKAQEDVKVYYQFVTELNRVSSILEKIQLNDKSLSTFHKRTDVTEISERIQKILDEKNPNQQVDPIVTTPVDEVEAQSTQGHP